MPRKVISVLVVVIVALCMVINYALDRGKDASDDAVPAFQSASSQGVSSAAAPAADGTGSAEGSQGAVSTPAPDTEGTPEQEPSGKQLKTDSSAAEPDSDTSESELQLGSESESDPEAKPEREIFDVTVNIAGDVMLASYRGSGKFADMAKSKDPSYFLGQVSPYFQADDLTVVNLENVLTDRSLKAVDKGYSPAYWYYGPTSNTEILTCASVEAVSLANNHTGDYGEEGRKDTIAAVENAGLLYGTDSQTIYYDKNGYTIAVICNGLWADYQADDIIERIKEANAKSDFQIVFYHGGKERVHTPESWRVEASRKLVDAGADLVIGNHPHVIQPREVYNGVDIIYSMGNFCFGDEMHAENRTLIYNMKLTVDSEGHLFSKTSEIIPCYVYTADSNNFCPAPIEDPEIRQRVLDFMDGKIDSPV